MRIRRLSIDFNYHREISDYERSRLMILGSHIESLFLEEGFAKLDIHNCNFVHLAVNADNDPTAAYSENEDKRISIPVYFDRKKFFEIKDLNEQLNYLLIIVYDALAGLAKKNALDIGFLTNIYSQLIAKELFIPFGEKDSRHPNKKNVKVILKNKYLFDCKLYKLDYFKKGQLKQSLDLCTISPIYLPAEHGGKPQFNDIEEVAMYPIIKGWKTEYELTIYYAHKEFTFNIETQELKVIEHEDLKSKYVNWSNIH